MSNLFVLLRPTPKARIPRSLAYLASAFLTLGSSLTAAEPASSPAAAHDATPAETEATPSAAEALQRLLEGNQRFVADRATHPDQTKAHRLALTKGQHPFAIVLTCSDSRVAPELYFDQGLGDLFVIRNAGNILDEHVLGSIEYAAEHLHAPLIIVVGHAKCGAVSAAVGGGHLPGHIHSIVEAIAPAVAETRNVAGEKIEPTVRANARFVAGYLCRSEPILKHATETGHVKVVAAYYDLTSGKVEILRQPSS